MGNYSQITNQDVENINDEEFIEHTPNENRELFKRALFDAIDMNIHEIEEQTEDVEIPLPSRRYKIQMNRLFCERVGGFFLPFPEEDNLYERLRSKLRIKLKINEVLDRCKERTEER